MAALTPTIVGAVLGAGGNFKIVTVTATLQAASDTITLTEQASGVKSLVAPVAAVLTGGMDANLQGLQVSVSGLVITIVSTNAAGGNATDWTGATVAVTVIGKTGESA